MNKDQNKSFNTTRMMNEAFVLLNEDCDIKTTKYNINKGESKYLYTAQLMNQALLKLLETKDLDYITITEITKKAGVNRSTFYLHYDNIYDLFEETVENINKEFINSFDIKSINEIVYFSFAKF